MFKLRKPLIFISIFLAAGLAVAIFIRQQYVVPILMYHSVSASADPQNRIAVSDVIFERQMRFLKDNHYNVLPLEELAVLIKEKRKIPSRSVVLTFDDGYKDNFVYAYPILKKYNFPATIFIIINEVNRPENDRLSWEEIRQMQDSGLITFGSHTFAHPWLPEIKDAQVLSKEISGSKKALEDKLGRQVFAFSYPGGRFNPEIRKMVIDSGYQLACATSPGKKSPDDDVFALKRLRISSNAGNLFVFWFETSGIYTFFKENRHK